VNRFLFVNQGTEAHHMLVIQLPDSLDASAAFRKIAAREPIPGSKLVGGPGAIPPGDSATTWARLDTGRYLIICFIPGADRVPHAMKGMFGQLEVSGAPLATRAPAASVTITAREYGFDFSRALRAGATTIELRNEGEHDHDLELVQLPDSGTAVAVAKQLGSGGGIPPGVRVVGGISSVAPNGRAWGRVTLTPGRYAALCFESDSTRRGSHYLHGMAREFVVR
jgi:hypothetical protein